MDKNTLIGMLLMGLVIFGFMWLQKPSEAEMAERQRQLDSIAAVQKAEQQRTITEGNVDTLSTDELAHLKSVLEGMPAGNATINNEGVVLTLHDGKISGTVKVGDKVLNWDDVTADESEDPASHNLAVQAVHQGVLRESEQCYLLQCCLQMKNCCFLMKEYPGRKESKAMNRFRELQV